MRAVAIAVIALCVASTAHAQSAKRFDRADANHDGRISLQEYEAFAGNRMMRAKGPHAEKFRSLDPEQQASVLQRRFRKLDHGGKGYLVPEDLPQRHG